MCGIAGYHGTRVIGDEAVRTCLERMRRRGPDAAGVYRAAVSPRMNLCLLHSRLAIIDLDERANQPFSVDGLVLAVNGEIYNYLEVRAALEAEGRAFRTRSDTEVLARALGAWGLDALDRLEGMWAFAVLDRRDGTLVLSRDRFGEKPLYLCRDDTGLYFASEVKFLEALCGRRFPVNREHLRRFLVNGYKSLYKTPAGFFLGVEELPAAGLLTRYADGREERARYWMPRIEPDEGMSRAEAVTGARDALLEAVRLRLRADVPLAFCMSGGVDSNSLISIARTVFDYDVHGFTIVNTDERYAEWDSVSRAVDELGIRHTAVPVRTDDFLPLLRELVRQHDAPVYTITYYAHWLLMSAVAANGYRIAVSGTGADELFSGYYDHHALYLHAVRDDPALFAESLRNWRRHVEPIVRNPVLRDPEVFVKNPGERGHIYLDAANFSARLREPFEEPFTEVSHDTDLLRMRMLNELFHEAVPVILHEDDLNAMYFSIENRSPFLDRGLFEMCGRIPTRHLIRDGFNKSVLRDAMRGIVPDHILDDRRKVGFNAPVFSFLDRDDPEVRAELLADGPVFDVVRREAVAELLDRPGALPNSESKFLFAFLGVKMFLEEYAS
ncbi:asparagine synthase (glutamine-hydrolysing) [Desulfobaculum xiamenense]|uniref:asparagine synthase (glutamine-hydrolyzing) n=1 Tax=Desulfobaculum xiamenense TaxID=995050 RepID=A0A846QJ41_9BACT|nr:asparagine synthase (glutamine-hydrolyzing) [Desulfobaculum xiamenense]NJB67090.1 asparagine synthase (glutamine-hydrolysing) [Desulfobaculum xiamenense]